MNGLEDMVEVAKLRRLRAHVRQLRKKTRRDPAPPGTLPEFMARASPDLIPMVHLRSIVARLEQIPFERVELCISAPPRMGKSTLIQHLAAWLLILNPKMRIAFVCYGAGFAEEQSAKVKEIYLRAGGVLGPKQTQEIWTTRAGGCVQACGLDGPLTGRGFHLVICDDAFKNEKQAYSRTIREGIVRGYRMNVHSRKNPRAAAKVPTSYIVSHTRWVDGDLVGSLADTNSAQPWEWINLPAINADGTALNPAFFTIEDIERDRRTLGEFAFAALHLGSPVPIGGSIFGPVTTIEHVEHGGSYRYAIGLDIVRSARSTSDWNVAVVERIHIATGIIDIVDVRREQGTLSDKVTGRGDEPIHDRMSPGFLRTLHSLCAMYPGAAVHMYCAKDETLLISLMASHREYPVKVKATLATTKKWLRAQPYASAWNDPSGRLRVLRTAPWFPEFSSEHVSFTGAEQDGELDDQVDAAAAAYDALALPAAGSVHLPDTTAGHRTPAYTSHRGSAYGRTASRAR